MDIEHLRRTILDALRLEDSPDAAQAIRDILLRHIHLVSDSNMRMLTQDLGHASDCIAFTAGCWCNYAKRRDLAVEIQKPLIDGGAESCPTPCRRGPDAADKNHVGRC